MRLPTAIQKHRDLIALNLLLLALAAAAATVTFGLHTNTLAQHPLWQSTKADLRRGVQGAISYTATAQPLARNRLNLGAWFGFQEVTSRIALDLAEFEVLVRYEPDGYVNVLYGIGPHGSSGVRISHRVDLPSLHFRATPDGEFTAADTLPLETRAAPGRWHRVRVRFDAAATRVDVDGHSAGSFEAVAQAERIGFRGGQRAAWVDNVVLRARDGRTRRESFANYPSAAAFGVIAFGGLVVLAALGLFGVRQGAGIRTVGLATSMTAILLVGGLGCAYSFQYFRPRNYPVLSRARKTAEAYWIGNSKTQVLRRLEADYPQPAPDGTTRLLFLGSSQTWGAGAMNDDQVWVRRLEAQLNAAVAGRRWDCLNAGIPGLTAASTLALLPELRRFNAHAAVINLSNNDRDTAVFRQNLDSLVTLVVGSGIRPVLILEPNSPERRNGDSPHGDLAVKHDIVRRVGARHGAPVIDLNRHLADLNATGFLWWDFVHLTAYGQRLVADKLAAELPLLLSEP